MGDAVCTDEQCTADGHICANAQYNAVDPLPCYESRAQIEQINFSKNLASFSKVSLDYWFYRYTALKSILG